MGLRDHQHLRYPESQCRGESGEGIHWGGIHATGMQVVYSDIESNSVTYGNGGGVYLSNGLMIFSTLRACIRVGGDGLFATGSSMASLTDEPTVAAGDHRTRWSGRDESGIRLPRGVYFARLDTSRETVTRRTVLPRD